MSDPLFGMVLQGLGGLSSASFYVPYTRIRGWSWEVLWIVGGIVSWLVAPLLFASVLTNDLVGVLSRAPHGALGGCFFWGALWGIGGLTFGLTMRFLGLSIGFAVSLGMTTVIATLGQQAASGRLGGLAAAASGRLVLLGIVLTVVGVAVVVRAAIARQREGAATTPQDGGGTALGAKRGIALAALSGVMSGCFAGGIIAGAPIGALSAEAGTPAVWQSLPALCVILAGGLATNAIWCGWRIARRGSAGQFVGRGTAPDAAATRGWVARNYRLAALGATLWYVQFPLYSMGESRMGRFGASDFTLHIAPIVLFATLWGFSLQEWAGVSTGIRARFWAGICVLLAATTIIGLGNLLAS